MSCGALGLCQQRGQIFGVVQLGLSTAKIVKVNKPLFFKIYPVCPIVLLATEKWAELENIIAQKKDQKSYVLPHMWTLDQGQTQQGD
jgi:hypothetical protein